MRNATRDRFAGAPWRFVRGADSLPCADMACQPIHRTRLDAARRRVSWCLAIAVGCGSALAQSDATTLGTRESDPLAWIGAHEVKFTAVAGPAGAELRAGPDANYTVVKRAAPGEPLLVVGDRNEHLAVLVPAGYRAFVNREFVALGEDGRGSIKGDAVNLRPKPSLEADYPIGRLESGRELEVIGAANAEETWLEVMAPGDIPLWVPDSEVEIVGDLTESSFVAKVAAAREARHADWVAHSPDARMAAAQRAHDEELTASLDGIERDIANERERGADADFTTIRAALAIVVAESGTESLRARAQGLLANLDDDERRVARERAMRAEALRLKEELEAERQRLIEAERRAVEDAKNTVGPRIAVGDRTTVLAFLRKKGDGTRTVYSLERGTTVVTRIASSNGRYRLEDFVGMQIEVTGRYVIGGATPTLEAERIVIQRR